MCTFKANQNGTHTVRSAPRSLARVGCPFPAEQDPNDGRRKNEALWSIFQIHHKRSRFIYDMFYRKKRISRELYEFCLREKYADAALIAKWKKVTEPTCRSRQRR